MVEGVDVRDVTLGSLRRQIGIVMQETTLFSGSIRENIGFGKADATEDGIIGAAQSARATEFISRLPQGYDTRVGERGVSLSGGQKQRVAIARALLMDPRILILDEFTSAVDATTERLIRAALVELMRGRTTFVIAHRLSTVRAADLILVLQHGRLVDTGTHEELLESSHVYREIHASQLADKEEAPLLDTALFDPNLLGKGLFSPFPGQRGPVSIAGPVGQTPCPKLSGGTDPPPPAPGVDLLRPDPPGCGRLARHQRRADRQRAAQQRHRPGYERHSDPGIHGGGDGAPGAKSGAGHLRGHAADGHRGMDLHREGKGRLSPLARDCGDAYRR